MIAFITFLHSCKDHQVTHLLYKHQCLTKLMTSVPHLQAANSTIVIIGKHVPLKSLSNVRRQSEIISGPNKLCYCHTAKVNQCLHRNVYVRFCNVMHSDVLQSCMYKSHYVPSVCHSHSDCLQYVNYVLAGISILHARGG